MIPSIYEEYTHYMLVQRVLCLEKQLADKMTPRDEFAKALIEMALTRANTYEDAAADAYIVADAMMKARAGGCRGD